MTSRAGLLLADSHRVAQGQIASQTASGLLRLFPLLISGGTIDTNNAGWLRAVIAVLTSQRLKSAGLAAQFATAYRVLELGGQAGVFTPIPAFELPLPAVTTSLSVLGPVAYRRELGRQLDKEPQALSSADFRDNRLPSSIQQTMAENVARAGMRHVRNGARDTIADVALRDPGVVGYVRSTSSKPCWFCAMLASRGPVYGKDSFDDSDPRFDGPGHHKVHDGCGCDLRALYTKTGGDFMDRSREFQKLWNATGTAQSFRAAFTAR